MGGVLSLPVAPKHFRVAALAEWILFNRSRDHAKYASYSAKMCWDAALMCAWEANGIRVPAFDENSSRGSYSVVGTDNYDQLFTLQRRVRSVAELRRLQKGTLIGFIGPRHNNHRTPNDLVLRHVMIYIGNGQGMGTKNDCVYTDASAIGWEKVDLTTFFDVNHADYDHNRHTTMVYTEVTGQTLR